jgi:alpha-L-fucosidase
MHMTLTRRNLLWTAAGAATSPVAAADWNIRPGSFTPAWESLMKYRCPDWFRDAKFGIWAVWGPESVPEAGDWYARNMYIEGSADYKYHLEHYGHPSKFGYKDIIALWKAENWDPDRLMRLYKKTGAKYFVAIANHHDNFDCWNSKHHAWNSVRKGPGKDVAGLWREAALKHGLRFGVTEHNARSWSWFNVNKGADKKGPFAGVPYDGNNPEYAGLYFPPHEEHGPAYPQFPPESYVQNWFLRTRDLIDSYRPDLMYYDGGVPFGEVGRKIVAHMYNRSLEWHGGRLEGVFNVKDWAGRDDHGSYREGTCVRDVERGVVNDIWPNAWQTDTCIGNWYYKRGLKYKTVAAVVHQLADIVSKNGNLLLNIPPKPDGTLDAEEEEFLEGLGKWMALNGEAVYGTRPWRRYGEGPTQTGTGHFNERNVKYTAEDLRFTTKPGVLYAIALGIPSRAVAIRSLEGVEPKSVRLLGADAALRFRRDAGVLTVELPDNRPGDHALVLKLEGVT